MSGFHLGVHRLEELCAQKIHLQVPAPSSRTKVRAVFPFLSSPSWFTWVRFIAQNTHSFTFEMLMKHFSCCWLSFFYIFRLRSKPNSSKGSKITFSFYQCLLKVFCLQNAVLYVTFKYDMLFIGFIFNLKKFVAIHGSSAHISRVQCRHAWEYRM